LHDDIDQGAQPLIGVFLRSCERGHPLVKIPLGSGRLSGVLLRSLG
jgi:hypothetical protein